MQANPLSPCAASPDIVLNPLLNRASATFPLHMLSAIAPIESNGATVRMYMQQTYHGRHTAKLEESTLQSNRHQQPAAVAPHGQATLCAGDIQLTAPWQAWSSSDTSGMCLAAAGCRAAAAGSSLRLGAAGLERQRHQQVAALPVGLILWGVAPAALGLCLL